MYKLMTWLVKKVTDSLEVKKRNMTVTVFTVIVSKWFIGRVVTWDKCWFSHSLSVTLCTMAFQIRTLKCCATCNVNEKDVIIKEFCIFANSKSGPRLWSACSWDPTTDLICTYTAAAIFASLWKSFHPRNAHCHRPLCASDNPLLPNWSCWRRKSKYILFCAVVLMTSWTMQWRDKSSAKTLCASAIVIYS